MKIFVTGGTGFIGRYTIESLSKTNHQVKLLVRKSSNITSLKYSNTTSAEGDLKNKESLLKGM